MGDRWLVARAGMFIRDHECVASRAALARKRAKTVCSRAADVDVVGPVFQVDADVHGQPSGCHSNDNRNRRNGHSDQPELVSFPNSGLGTHVSKLCFASVYQLEAELLVARSQAGAWERGLRLRPRRAGAVSPL